jgi:hypothetical protein
MNDQSYTLGMYNRKLDECEREWLGNKFHKVTYSSLNTYGEFVYLFSDSPGESRYDPSLKIWSYVDGEPNPDFFEFLKREGKPSLNFPK